MGSETTGYRSTSVVDDKILTTAEMTAASVTIIINKWLGLGDVSR